MILWKENESELYTENTIQGMERLEEIFMNLTNGRILMRHRVDGSPSIEEKIELSFTDDIGYTAFSIDRKWYEKQHLTDVEKLYHLACADEESDLSDCTGNYYE